MEVAFIRPTSYLKVVGDGSRYHLVLAQEVLRDGDYTKYYLDKSKQGDTLILDNGAAEDEDLSWDELDDAICCVEPTIVAAQDIIFGGKRSLERTFKHVMHLKERFPEPPAIMGIPQLDDKAPTMEGMISGFLACYKAMDSSSDIQMIGISKYAVPGGATREVLIQRLEKMRVKKPIHLLGLSPADGALEPLMYRKSKLDIRGIDSSHFILHAMQLLPPTAWEAGSIKNRGERFMKMEASMFPSLEVVELRLNQYAELLSDV